MLNKFFGGGGGVESHVRCKQSNLKFDKNDKLMLTSVT